MGTGSDIAIESAAVTLLGGDLGGIVRALNLSRATMRNIRQNLFFSLLSTMRPECRSQQDSLSRTRPVPVTHVRGSRDGGQLGLGPSPNALRLRIIQI